MRGKICSDACGIGFRTVYLGVTPSVRDASADSPDSESCSEAAVRGVALDEREAGPAPAGRPSESKASAGTSMEPIVTRSMMAPDRVIFNEFVKPLLMSWRMRSWNVVRTVARRGQAANPEKTNKKRSTQCGTNTQTAYVVEEQLMGHRWVNVAAQCNARLRHAGVKRQ